MRFDSVFGGGDVDRHTSYSCTEDDHTDQARGLSQGIGNPHNTCPQLATMRWPQRWQKTAFGKCVASPQPLQPTTGGTAGASAAASMSK